VRTVADIIFGVTGQTVAFDAPEGRPSSVTSAEAYRWDSSDDDTSETSALGSGSVETDPNTTIDATSGAGQADPRVLFVTATTGFAVDRSYLVTGADGYKEWFDCAEIDSANSVTAKHPLHNAYAAADTVQSTRITATVDPTWVADETNLRDAGPNPAYRIRWVYVVGGVTYVADTYFNLVRYIGAHGVRPQDVEALHPGWLDRLPTDHYKDQGRKLINEAHREVKLDLHAVWTDDAMVAHAEVIDELTRWRALELAEMARVMAGGSDGRAYEMARQAYRDRLDSLVRIASKVPIRDVAGAASQRSAQPLTRR
jgi:hypothetical protein